ncbi:hypothetical protein AGDE_01668 [Angomonas deanei]|nr:hypothetical protein AGDE_01668 [Angomonas deanei]|eukprot:EPY42255.1 hypothetical protein AGDE_01668 [Angomonas deanei]
MEGAAVKQLIQTWRSLNAKRKERNQELEELRNGLVSLENDAAKGAQEWDLEKENIKVTISAIASQVLAKQEELDRIQKESDELKSKVAERRRRNEEHLAILHMRQKNILDRKKDADAKDMEAKERYSQFVHSRDEAKQQLLEHVRRVEESLPTQSEAHREKCESIKSRIREINATKEAENKSWQLEQAMKEWNAKSDARKYILEDVNAAESGKDIWADTLHELSTIDFRETDKSLAELRSLIML